MHSKSDSIPEIHPLPHPSPKWGKGRGWGLHPANQYASPYVGMGNNPANRIDPDGREDNMRNYWINYYREINMFATTQSYSRYLEQDRWYGRGMYEGNPQFYWLANVSSGGFNATFSPQGGHSSPDGPSTIILAGDYISDNGGKIVHSNLYTSANHPGELGAYFQVNLSPGKGGSTVYTKDYKGNITGHISVTEAARCIWVSAGAQGQGVNYNDPAGGGGIDPSITAGIALGGGMIGGLEQSYTYGNHNIKYAQRVNGRVRASTVLTRANQMNATKMATGLMVVGRYVTGLSVAVSGYQFANSDMSGYDYARLSGSLIILSTAAIPIFGPLISTGLGIADSYGAFDGIYNYFERP